MSKIDFPDWLQSELDARNWSQADLARESGIMPASISRLLQGTRNPGPDACNAIAKAFGYPPVVVFRVAGLLPPQNEMSAETEQVIFLFEQLSGEDQQVIISLVETIIEQRKGKSIE